MKGWDIRVYIACILTNVGKCKKREAIDMELPTNEKVQLKKYKGTCIFASCENEEIEKMAIKDDDTWVISFPRSGTTLTQEIVYLLKHKLDFDGARARDLNERFPFLDLHLPARLNFRGLSLINQQTTLRLIKSHLHYHLLPPDLFKSNCKKVYVMRNPKDVFVSWMMLSKFFQRIDPDVSTDVFLDRWLNDDEYSTPWWLHVHDFWCHKDDTNILILQYEKIVQDMPSVIKRIAKHLEVQVTDEEVAKIADHCSFRNMITNKSVNGEWLDSRTKNKNFGGLIRKGKIGGWRDYLTQEMSDKLDAMVELKLGHLHIPFDYGQ